MIFIRSILACIGIAFSFNAAAADPLITKPVTLVVAGPPGGVTDMVARALSVRLSKTWGQPVIVDNKPGANQAIGAGYVSRAKPDGLTLLIFESAAFTINPHLYQKLSYDPKNITLITVLGRLSPVIVVSPSIPANNIAEFIALAKTKPDSLNFGSFGIGSYAHIGMEEFDRETGISMTHVPYQGSAPAVQALLSGQISAMLVTINVVEHFAKLGKLKILATATTERLALQPDIPTVEESGVPGFAPSAWVGLAAPKGLPPPLLNKIYDDVAKILADPDFKAVALATNGLKSAVVTPAEFPKLVEADSAAWGAAIKAANITAE